MNGAVPQPDYINVEYFFGRIYSLVMSIIRGDGFGISHLLDILGILFTIIALILIAVIIYSRVRIFEIDHKESKAHKELFKKEGVSFEPVIVQNINPRWEVVQKHIKSENPSDWKLAILEADLMLEDLLTIRGYKGESLGEKLKSVEASDFPGYDRAWWAHRVRNNIAHQGSAYVLGKAEARNTIEVFEEVFKANNFI